jgi:CheY-like chemotaxis protein
VPVQIDAHAHRADRAATRAQRPRLGGDVSAFVLWVEDNPSDVILLRAAFHELGVAVDLVVAENAVQFFKHMTRREASSKGRPVPDLILIDLNLPVLSGAQVLAEARQHKPWAKVPMVVLSTSSDPAEVSACLRLGAVVCMTKPRLFQGYLNLVSGLRRYLPVSDGQQVGMKPESGPAEDASNATLTRATGTEKPAGR